MFCPQNYSLVANFLPKLLGLIYFFATTALFCQIQGLVGKEGILPLHRYLKTIENSFFNRYLMFFYYPILFWLNASNRALLFLTGLAMLCSLVLALGFLPSLMLFFLYILYLSLKIAGQEFLSFGWEGLLLEITAQTFLMSLTAVPNLFIWISINFLLFRFHFQAGIAKLQSNDPNWRHLKAVYYHYETQPLPNTIAWYIHKMPLWFHQFSTLAVLILEILIPFGIFFSENIRWITFIALFGLQFMIWLTGNFSYLNHLTMAFLTILISNTYVLKYLSVDPIESSTSPIFVQIIFSIAGIILIGLQAVRLWHQIYPHMHLNRILEWISPFYLANRYTIFAYMTTVRYEVVIEGSIDGNEWKEYIFHYKPSAITTRPTRISPYQPRLDWQAWFLPFRDFDMEPWFLQFIYHLLKGTPHVLSLLKENPFLSAPPKYVRSCLYVYKFTSFQEKQQLGQWWKRQMVDIYSPPMKLHEDQ